jgi:aspartyl protease family protein
LPQRFAQRAPVAAIVLPAGVAPENLLGLSFLRRRRRFEYSDGKLVLEQ